MLRRLSILPLLFLFLTTAVKSQGIVFEKEHIDLGEVRNWGLQPAVFHFTNTSSARVFILKTDAGSDLRVVLPKGYVQPGASDSVMVYFIPKRKESFKASVKVWASDRNRPYSLSLQGETVSLDECPGTPGAAIPDPERLVKVVEKGSGEPIPGAEVVLTRSRNEKFRDHTDRRGQYSRQLRPGLYEVSVKHEGYLPHGEEFYLDRATLILVFELEPRMPEEVPDTLPIAVIPPPPPDPEPEPAPNVTGDTAAFVLIIDDEDVEPLIPYPGDDTLGDRYLPWEEFRQNNIVFLIDVSSSMRSKDKLPLLKLSMSKLVTVLRGVDHVSVIVYANEPTVLVEGAGGDEKVLLNGAVDSLQAKGNTYGIKGLSKAYEIAERNFIPGANNLVILATDGEFNSPDYSGIELMNMVSNYAGKDIHTSVVGFGQGTRAGIRMRQMAMAGQGSYMHIESGNDKVEEILVEEIRKRSRR